MADGFPPLAAAAQTGRGEVEGWKGLGVRVGCDAPDKLDYAITGLCT